MSEYIYGRNVVKQRLEDQKEIISVKILDSFKDKEILSLIYKQRLPIEKISKKAMDNLIGHEKHQGVALEISGYKYAELEDIIQNKKGEYPLIVMLDGIEDPHNLGAVLRTGDAIGVDGVIIGKHRSVELNATVAKVSTGAIDHVPVCKVTNLSQTLEKLKEVGFWVVGADMDTNAQRYDMANYDMPLVLVIGNEGSGISSLVRKHCDFFVFLPMKGAVSSLNASVATAILLYEINRKR